MTAFDGWLHDRSGSAVMLITEALVCLMLIVVMLVILRNVPALGLKTLAVPSQDFSDSSAE
jgi:hypothetical protein